MDSENGGQSSAGVQNSSSDLGRQTAASIARKKVLAAYVSAAQPTAETNTSAATPDTTVNPSATGTTRADVGSHLKDQAVTSRINSESWKRYHSEWQNYYQKYYSSYYAQAARNYVEKERLKDARKRAEDEAVLSSLPHVAANPNAAGDASAATTAPTNESVSSLLKRTIRAKATENVKVSHRHRRWIPVLAGVAVMLIILFLQYNRLIFAPIFAYMSPGNAPASEIEAIDPTVTQAVSADPRLLIPKLNVDVPVHFGIPASTVMSAMNNGVAHYRIAGASAFPGQIGNTVITGHSAGDIYSSNPYKYIFSGLERLGEGDLIYINYESVRYTYRVTREEVIEPTNVAALQIETDRPMLTLVTCTPLGTSRYRLLVFAEQISPSYEGADQPATSTDPTTDESLPSNEPSLFESVWNFLTGN